MTSCEPQARDIWLAYVEFTDHPGIGKVRPVVVISESEPTSVVAAKITTAANFAQSDYLEIGAWESCGLRRLSWIQLEPLFEVRRDKLLRDAPIGRLPAKTFDLLVKALENRPE